MVTYDKIEQLKNIKFGLIDDLIELGNQKGKLDEVDKLSHAIKNLCKVIEDGEQHLGMGEYSQARYSMAPYYMTPDYSYRDGWSMAPEYSQARGRGPGASRDSMGRYSSHDGGDYISSLYTAMNYAKNDSERQNIQNLINMAQQGR